MNDAGRMALAYLVMALVIIVALRLIPADLLTKVLG